MRAVIQGGTGLYCYERVSELEALILGAAEELDQDDVDAAWLLYNNPDMVVFGPNDVVERRGDIEKR